MYLNERQHWKTLHKQLYSNVIFWNVRQICAIQFDMHVLDEKKALYME